MDIKTTTLNRTQAALEIMRLYNSMETRKVSFKTIYNRVFRDGDTGNWRYLGRGYDYTV